MADALRHRGPDAEGFHVGTDVALGMRRLSIIDVAGGSQPVFNETGDVAAVFNGEIYNFAELRARLSARGHRFTSESDSEVIPHLYEEHGEQFAQHLRGMFAIALWDRRSRTLLLVRDRLGKKPLYYAAVSGGLVFGSELKAILEDERVPRTASKLAISQYLTFQYVPAPLSAVESVHKLEPAHLLRWRDGAVSIRPYWSLRYADANASAGDEHLLDEVALAEELRQRIEDCVRVRLVSERPLGAFLSGGLDSSAIVAAMSRVSTATVKTFSIGFEEESHNELPYARRVAQRYGTEHHEMIVRPDAAQVMPRLARSFDEPFADASAIPSFYLAEMTRQQVVVALNGDGGDETFGGYRRYPAFLQLPSRLPSRATQAALAIIRILPAIVTPRHVRRRAELASGVLRASTTAERYGRMVSYFRPEPKALLLTSAFQAEAGDPNPYERLQAVWDAHHYTDPVNRLLAVDTATYLPGDLLPKVDITTMAVSLEARSPLLDHTLMEWAAGLPGSLKIRGMTTKHLLKQALVPWLDDDLIHRQKTGFGVPLNDWFRGPLRGMLHDVLTDDTARNRGWFEPAAVRSLLDRHEAGENWAPQLYALLMLELWHREVLDARAPVGR